MSKEKTRNKRGMVTSYTLLVAIIFVVGIVTWVLSGITPDVTPASLADLLGAPVNGFTSALGVCVFVMVLGGFIGIMNATGALDTGISVLVRRLGDKSELLIPVLMTLFGICGSTYGMMEETVPFYLLLATVTFSSGFDTMVGAMIVLLGAGLGTLGSTINPFSVGVASAALTDLNITVNQGTIILLGFINFVVAEGLGIVFVMRYARRVKTNPESSGCTVEERELAAASFEEEKDETQEDVSLTSGQKRALALFAFSFVIMIVSFIPWESFGVTVFQGWSSILTGQPLGSWYFGEATIWFLLMAVLIGLLSGMGEKELVGTFVRGSSDMVGTAFVIALARGVSVVMNSTGLDMYVLNAAADMLTGVPAAVFAPAAYLVLFGLSFLIPSSSGLATVAMPIMGPLAVNLGFSPEVMIMIFVVAHGAVAMLTPANGVIVGGLELAKTSYTSFLKVALKFLLLVSAVTAALMTIAMMLF